MISTTCCQHKEERKLTLDVKANNMVRLNHPLFDANNIASSGNTGFQVKQSALSVRT